VFLESDYRLSRATRNILLAEGKIAELRAELDGVARRIVETLTLLEGLAIDDDVTPEDQPDDVVEVVDREGEPEAMRVIEPRSERRG
jgi:hypothetical protein